MLAVCTHVACPYMCHVACLCTCHVACVYTCHIVCHCFAGFMGYAPELHRILQYNTLPDDGDDQAYYTSIFLDRALRVKPVCVGVICVCVCIVSVCVCMCVHLCVFVCMRTYVCMYTYVVCVCYVIKKNLNYLYCGLLPIHRAS